MKPEMNSGTHLRWEPNDCLTDSQQSNGRKDPILTRDTNTDMTCCG